MTRTLPLVLLIGCTGRTVETDVIDTDTDTGTIVDTSEPGWIDDTAAATDPFADALVSFTAGDAAGFGQDDLPDVVLGPPRGTRAGNPSLDVVSLGDGGVIVVQFTDVLAIDGEGPDLVVFENPLEAWPEPGRVAVSEDGTTWHEFPCDPAADGAPGCAGTHVVFAGPGAEDPTDPAVSGGDLFDLADVGLASAAYVRITDAGTSHYDGSTGGFDLDAIAVIEP